jgi:hypothetical protein
VFELVVLALPILLPARTLLPGFRGLGVLQRFQMLFLNCHRGPSFQPNEGEGENMRYIWLPVLYFCFAISTGSAQTASSQTFPLPKSHVWEPKTAQICSSVGRVGIRQAKETPDPSEYFIVESGRGDSRLEITLREREVLVSVDGAKPESYRVVANTVGVLTAVLIGEIDATVSSISIDKVTSYVIWSTTEPRDFTRDVPRHTAAILVCSPASKS